MPKALARIALHSFAFAFLALAAIGIAIRGNVPITIALITLHIRFPFGALPNNQF
jgi:hypothetical protein